ncbi:MAG TPA: class I SAM-dependent methyltransferase, partial [Candidatus Limnocylindria bacterium]|nr:class I SAM-dependent methyltransferase [Candidatus Limnocylindria bacterium]
MAFDVAADAYDRFMGRYSRPLAPLFADFAGLTAAESMTTGRLLDVGAGPGALTGELAQRFGEERVVAVEPSASFVAALRTRLPQVHVAQASAEDLPFADDAFDATLAQLVVHFMRDPVEGLSEMRRVTRPGGTVAACVWDLGGGRSPMSPFWRAAAELDPAVEDETDRPGVSEGHLARLFRQAGLRDIESAELTVHAHHVTFDEWWDPFTGGAGPAGSYLASLDQGAQDRLRDRVQRLIGAPPVVIEAVAWAARGRVRAPAGT